jgi:hypothetical protein
MPILFKRENLKKVLDGRKTQTRRQGKLTYRVGQRYGVKDRYFGKPAAYVVIRRRWRERLGDISPEDAGKEGYSNIWTFKAAWIRLHGHWDPTEEVTAYEFALWKGNGRVQGRINGSATQAVEFPLRVRF